MKEYYALHPAGCAAAANRLYKYVLFTKNDDDNMEQLGKKWAHEKLRKAINIQFGIIEAYEEACGKIPDYG